MTSAGFFDYPGGDSDQDPEELVFLGEWSDADWERLFEYTQTHRFQPGDRIVTAGATDRALYLIASGQLDVVADVGRKRQSIATVDEGSVVGEQGFLDGRPAGFDVVATTPVEALRLSFPQFESLAGHHPELARSFLLDLGRLVSLRLRETTRMMLRRR